MSEQRDKITRRKFLQTAAAIGLVPSLYVARGEEKIRNNNKILNYNPDMRYRRFCDTDIYLSVISLGGIGVMRSIAHYAIDHGVNLVHMSSTYKGGHSMVELGSVLKEKRDKVYIALKDNFFKGKLEDIDEILKTLNTDYVDFLMFNRHEHTQVADPKITELFEKWKDQGKVRFAGLTSHEDVQACVKAGISSSMYSLIMPVLNQPNLELMEEDLKISFQKQIGIMAMKTIKGVEDPKLQFAYLKKILRNPAVTTVVKGFNTFDQFDMFLKATQEALSHKEDNALYRYAQKNRAHNCMMCGECKRSCPINIEIPTILRCKDYYFDQMGDHDTAMNTYHSISPVRQFDPSCSRCGKCEDACPNGINIIQKLSDANRLFNSNLV
jgi:predicted aldo/keto reductase-like oxidoreductase